MVEKIIPTVSNDWYTCTSLTITGTPVDFTCILNCRFNFYCFDDQVFRVYTFVC